MAVIPLELLDHIFGFLITDPASLIACSEAHPLFSQMVEKYQYHKLTINPSTCDLLIKLLSEKPRIANYVRVLRIESELNSAYPLFWTTTYFERIAVILPVFPVLERIVLSYHDRMITWERDLPQVFRRAMEDCLRLPTLRGLHIDSYIDDFPVSILDGHANIDCFSLCGVPKISEVVDTTYPQLKSLSITGFYSQHDHISFGAWVKSRISRLQSLKYDYSSDGTLLELLELCSDTLTTLDLTLGDFVDIRCESSALPQSSHFVNRLEFYRIKCQTAQNVTSTSPALVGIMPRYQSISPPPPSKPHHSCTHNTLLHQQRPLLVLSSRSNRDSQIRYLAALHRPRNQCSPHRWRLRRF